MADTTHNNTGAALAAVAIAAALAGGITIGWLLNDLAADDDQATIGQPVRMDITSTPPTSSPTADSSEPTITSSEYDAITVGMTRAQVEQIIGGPGDTMSEVGIPGDQFHTAVVMWMGDDGAITGANANVSFQADRVTSKAQFGLNL